VTYRYIVICRDDRKDEDTPGDYVMATHGTFITREAAEHYAKGVSPSREAIVVEMVKPLYERPVVCDVCIGTGWIRAGRFQRIAGTAFIGPDTVPTRVACWKCGGNKNAEEAAEQGGA
jgi:hypothetical protein